MKTKKTFRCFMFAKTIKNLIEAKDNIDCMINITENQSLRLKF